MLTERKIKQVKTLLADWEPQTTGIKTGLSLHDIAKKTGLTYSAVHKIRSGKYDKVKNVEPTKPGKAFNVNKFKNWLITVLILISCSPAKDIQLTVTHIQEVNGKREVYARRGYQVWMATVPYGVADSLKRGSVIRAGWTKEKCEWVFIRVK